MHVAHLLVETYGTCYLEIRKAIFLCSPEERLVHGIDRGAPVHLIVDVDDVLEFLKEPHINLCHLVDLLRGVDLSLQSFGNHEDTLVCR